VKRRTAEEDFGATAPFCARPNLNRARVPDLRTIKTERRRRTTLLRSSSQHRSTARDAAPPPCATRTPLRFRHWDTAPPPPLGRCVHGADGARLLWMSGKDAFHQELRLCGYEGRSTIEGRRTCWASCAGGSSAAAHDKGSMGRRFHGRL
jgi:hypothetical protein